MNQPSKLPAFIKMGDQTVFQAEKAERRAARVAKLADPHNGFDDPHNFFIESLTVTPDLIMKAFEVQAWKFAKSQPQWPHEYIVRKNWVPCGLPWENMIKFVWENAVTGWFQGGKTRYKNRYWRAAGWRFWPMDPTWQSTDLLNRAEDVAVPYQGYDHG